MDLMGILYGGMSMLNSNAFNYINVLDKAADASWTRETILANNIANVDTPGYKRQDLDFESLLKKEMGRSMSVSFDEKIKSLNGNLNDLNPIIYKDHSGYSYRLDGNNVDIENENVMLAENQLKYQGLLTSITQEFTNLQAVMK